ncbi:hypothetical protein N7462_005907 [Penicillium macrosclerotiorum]|uniref:uncharacterized protein n=1 Tax=Penicillium macrosclerotiorum TaxID=303699 RepID=UPI002547DB9E|nr:uncharacterized protein N7462_005907 [Penicillium macrosclerotiorum]KAJ5682742.1 hypothetical protein N7462_005907 [Penicillium macrosclerotiorum]
MVTTNAVFARQNWVPESRAVVHHPGSGLAAPKDKETMTSRDGGLPKKRESRSGTRKVSSLSAEQLERKRANDREAQRSIRQRTKEHIEQLENQVNTLRAQVAEMRPKSERFDELLRQNTALQDEVGRLKRQLGPFAGRPMFTASSEQIGAPFRGGWPLDDSSSNAGSSLPATSSILPSQLAGPSHLASSLPRAPSAVSGSSQSSHQHDWPTSYTTTRSPSLGESSDPEFSTRMESYVIDGQLQRGSRLVSQQHIPVATPQINFAGCPSPGQTASNPSFSQLYSVSQHPQGQPDGLASSAQPLVDQSVAGFLSAHQPMSISMSMSGASASSQPPPGQPYPSQAPTYQNPTYSFP